MAQQNVIFQQKTNGKGECEFRLKFGRQKALVFKKHMESGFFYLDLYDNRPGRSDRIGFGLDELDQLISIRSGLDTLKQCFTDPQIQQMKGGVATNQRPPTPPAIGNRYMTPPPPPPTLRPYVTIERLPFQEYINQSKRPASRDAYPDAVKKPRVEFEYENLTPTEQNESTAISAEMYNELFHTTLN